MALAELFGEYRPELFGQYWQQLIMIAFFLLVVYVKKEKEDSQHNKVMAHLKKKIQSSERANKLLDLEIEALGEFSNLQQGPAVEREPVHNILRELRNKLETIASLTVPDEIYALIEMIKDCTTKIEEYDVENELEMSFLKRYSEKIRHRHNRLATTTNRYSNACVNIMTTLLDITKFATDGCDNQFYNLVAQLKDLLQLSRIVESKTEKGWPKFDKVGSRELYKMILDALMCSISETVKLQEEIKVMRNDVQDIKIPEIPDLIITENQYISKTSAADDGPPAVIVF